MAYLGIDLHSNSFKVAKLEALENEKVMEERRYTMEEESFNKFLRDLNRDDYILIEASTNAFWFYDQVIPYVKECYIYNVTKGKNQGNKTDKIDSRSLAKKLAFYVLLGEEFDLPLVYVPNKEARELRSLVTTYNLLGKMIIQSKNRIHALFKQDGICIAKSTIDKKYFEKSIDKINISNIYKSQVKCLIGRLKSIQDERKTIKDMIYVLGERLYSKEIKLLLSIKEFSPFTAIVLMSDVVDINRFKNSKKLCAYLRTAPKIKESNNTTHFGHVNKLSRKATCSLLTQSVNHFKVAGDHMSCFYNRVKNGKSAGKSRMALIRKMLVCTYHMLKKGELYYWVDDDKYQEKLRDYSREVNRIEENNKKIEKVA